MNLHKSKYETIRDKHSTYFCLKCFEFSETQGECCDFVKIRLTEKPKEKILNKSICNHEEWSSFINTVSTQIADSEYKKEILNDISKKYILTHYEFSRCYENLEKIVQKELSETITVEDAKPVSDYFYISTKDSFSISESSNKEDIFVLNNKITPLIHKHARKRVQTKELETNKSYFVVLVYATDGHTFYFPTSYDRYLVYEGTCFFSYNHVGTKIKHNCYINVNVGDTSHTFPLDIYIKPPFKDKIQQNILIFETIEEAEEFQKQYIKIVSDHFGNLI